MSSTMSCVSAKVQPTARASVPSVRASKAIRPVAFPKVRSVQAAPAVQGRRSVVVKAAEPETTTSSSETKEQFYELNLEKPLGIKFARGNDGGAYVIASDATVGATDDKVEVGDKVVAISASFGSDVWEARNYGQVMYAIKTRAGGVYLKFESKYGDVSALQEEEVTEAEQQFRGERAGGNYGAGTKEIQTRNYVARKEAERVRRELFDDALDKFRSGKIEDALIDFENVKSMEPKNYLGDDFSRTTQIYRVTCYNMACCYSDLKQVDAGLDSLEDALACGFEDFKKCRNDKNLANLRESEKFKQVMDKYDEPIINEAAINAIKGFFSFGKKDDDLP